MPAGKYGVFFNSICLYEKESQRLNQKAKPLLGKWAVEKPDYAFIHIV